MKLRTETTRRRDAPFERYVRERRPALVRTATVLAAGDRHLAEDLVQTALTRCYLARPPALDDDLDGMHAYVRRSVVNALTDHHRRPFMRRERTFDAVPEAAAVSADSTDDPQLLRALAGLPAGMRAAVVLRHVEQLTVEETAAALGCSTGTVKSQTARGLDKLRAALGERAPVSTTTKEH